MSLRLVLRPEAESDIAEAALWYEQQRAGLGSEFIDEVSSAVERVLANPGAYRPQPHRFIAVENRELRGRRE